MAMQCFVLLVFLAPCAFAATLERPPIPDKCVLPKSEEYGYVIMRHKELKQDPFVEALGVFIDDLKKLEVEGEDMTGLIGVFERNDCDPHNREASRFYDAAEPYTAQCTVPREATESEISACWTQYNKLLAWSSQIQGRYNVLHQKELQLAERVANFDTRARKARLNAENVLDFDNTEQVLRLYVRWLRSQRAASGQPTSCESFAKMFEVLGKRVKNTGLMIDYLSRTLIEERFDISFLSGDPRFRPIAGSAFDASGFRREYYHELSENQVRHALAFINTGYHKLRTPALVGSFFLDYVADTEEDFELAIIGAKLGVDLRIGTYNAAVFGGAVRGALCR